MNTQTINQLIQINKEFYEKVGESFDSTRQTAWLGWEKMLDFFKEIRAKKEVDTLEILDVACGNGRFLGYITEQLTFKQLRYTGLDSDENLLKKGAERYQNIPGVQAEFEKADIVKMVMEHQQLAKNSTVDLVTAFGFMHHVPSFELRLQLVNSIKETLTDKGLACVSFWRVGTSHPLMKRAVAPPPEIDQADLEVNDVFLDWQRGPTPAVRYAHLAGSEEITKLFEQSSVTIRHRYTSDSSKGVENEYVIFSR